MRQLRAILSRVAATFRKQERDRELDDELQSHLQMLVDDKVRAGMTPEAARREAISKLGAIEPAKEAYRDRRGLPALETVLQDVRYAFRTLRKEPAFTAVVVLTLALGVGANTAIFSLIDAVLLKMLPVQHPEQLVFVNTTSTQVGGIRLSRTILNRDADQIRKRARSIAGLAGFSTASTLNVAVNGHAELISGLFVSGQYFQVLGVPAAIGRTLGPEDTHADSRVAMFDYAYWERRFGADPSIIGRVVTINNVPVTIIGVMAREFYGVSSESEPEVVLPMALIPQTGAVQVSSDEPKPDDSAGYVFARLKPGVTQRAAASELGAIFRQTELDAERDTAQRAVVEKLAIELTPASRGFSAARNRFSEPLLILMVVVGLVMLIACANIANLLLARASARQREIAIRLSVGSSRGRIIRQLLTESLILSVLGGVGGLALAVWARSGIVYLVAEQDATGIPASWDGRVFGFTAAICILNALLFGLAPAFRATGIELTAILKGSRAGRAIGQVRLGKVLVAGQVAISLVLLIAAGLFLNTFCNLGRVDLGFDRNNTIVFTLDPSLAGYQGSRVKNLFRQIEDQVSRLPGIQAVTLMRNRMLGPQVSLTRLWVPGYTLRPGEDASNQWVVIDTVGPDFFHITGMHLIGGRDFTARDDDRAAKVAIINQTMAQHYFAGQSPLGKHIAWSRNETPIEIVGIVCDMKYMSVRDWKQDVVFTPILQEKPDAWNEATLIVRSAASAGDVTNAVRTAIRTISSNIPVYHMKTMNEVVSDSLVQQRLLAILSGFFGLLAVGLSAVGLYGVQSYVVIQRTSEIGVRMALGAPQHSMLRLVLGDTARMLLIGVAIGLAAAFASARLVQSALYGVSPSDPGTMIAAAALLTAAALLAGLIPARRASRVDPMVALRYE